MMQKNTFRFFAMISVAVLCINMLSCNIANTNIISDIDSTTNTETIALNELNETVDYGLKKHVAYVLPYYDSINDLVEQGIIENIEKLPHTPLEEAPLPPSTNISVGFLNKTFTGSYSGKSSSKKTIRHGQYHYEYKTDQGDVFQVNEQGIIVKWIRGSSSANTSADKEISLDEAIAICRNLIPEEFFSTFKDYTIEVAMDPHTMPDVTDYAFAFVSLHNNVQVAQRASFTISTTGEVLRYDSQNLGRYTEKSTFDNIDDNMLYDIVDKLLVNKTIQYEIYNKFITLANDGTLLCSVKITFTNNNDYIPSLNIEIPLE